LLGLGDLAALQAARADVRALGRAVHDDADAPSFDYFHTTIYWNPKEPRAAAAANSVAKLFAPADVKKVPSAIAPLQNGAMLTVVVGRTFHGSLAPSAPVKQTPTREPAHVQSNPYDTSGPLRAVQPKVGFKLMVPTVLDSSSSPDSTKPLRAYKIEGNHHAVRLVYRNASGQFWGIEETDWDDAPVLADRSVHHVLGGRSFDFYYNGSKLHMVVLRQKGATYWVVNSLLDNLSNETMIAIAKGLKPLRAK
jgi:hypothetical protein